MSRILVTGATGGIGQAVVQRLGYSQCVRLSSRQNDGFKVCDLSSDVQTAQFAKKTAVEGKVDKIVFAHGIYRTGSILDLSSQAQAELMQVNAYAIPCFLEHFLLHTNLEITVCLVSSIVADQGSLTGNAPVYAASKAASLNFLKSIAKKHQRHKYFAIAPGPTNTSMLNGRSYDEKDVLDPLEVAELIADGFQLGTDRTTLLLSKKDNRLSKTELRWT